MKEYNLSMNNKKYNEVGKWRKNTKKTSGKAKKDEYIKWSERLG
nr:hypothetical protein [Mycoplasmopsis bovis]